MRKPRRFGVWLAGAGASLAVIAAVAAGGTVVLPHLASAHSDSGQGRTLAPTTQFYTPHPDHGAIQQIAELTSNGQKNDAALLQAMIDTPQAVWFNGGTPKQTEQSVKMIVQQAQGKGTVPVLVAYNIPGRDCGQYSSGGAATDADYQAWISAFAQGIGSDKAVVLLEPDALANLPSDCGGAYAGETNPPTDASRTADIAYAVNALEADPNVSVYLDAGHSAWHSVGDMASRLVAAGVQNAQGFYLNVSNYQYSHNQVKFGTWISDCIAMGGGSTSYNYSSNCPNQYWNGGPATNWNGTALTPYSVWIPTWDGSNATLNTTTAGIDSRYTGVTGTTHFVIDTSRNGTGPNSMATYASAPYNQPANVVSTLQSGNWCNPTGAGLGLAPTANTAGVSPLLDAYLWVKTPGQSDGQCDSAGGVRAWDYGAYTQPGWPTTTATQATFDPLWGLTDPAAGAWFAQQALQLAQNASPALTTSK